MTLNSVCVFLFCLTSQVVSDSFQDTLGHIKPRTSPKVQSEAAFEVVKRTIPQRADEFYIEIDPDLGVRSKDTFQIWKQNGIINIKATTGVTATTGFHYYLKYYCNAHISWEASQLNLPEFLPEVNITITLNDRFRYYQNVCTTSYSFVWWNWKQWEKHIDWIALNSFNLVLAFNGQEAIWERVYKKLNLTQQDIDEHFTGPAFLSWLRMGNIRGWGGPLSKAWHERSIWLQKKILEKMRNLGIIPVLPAFAGHLPKAFRRIYPEVNVTQMERWNQFNNSYCCPNFLEPTEPMFKTIGKMFLEEQTAEFGTDHVYNCDSFNEVDPSTSDLTYLANVGKNIYAAMVAADPQAIWMMQGWLFVHSLFFWTRPKVKALLTSVPKGKLIILDLQSEQFPQYNRLEQYYGQPYIWCMLHDFGGTLGMFGSAKIINENVIEARKAPNGTMIGIGLTPEGINQNYVIYDLMTESSWRTEPAELDEWFKNYTIRRYGNLNDNMVKAWHLLQNSVYSYSGLMKMRGRYAVTNTPSLRLNIWTWYVYNDVFEAWSLFRKSSADLKHSSTFQHDFVDLSRQVLQIRGDIFYRKLISSFQTRNYQEFEYAATYFLDVFDDMEKILSSNEAFLLGPWIQSAKACANDSQEEKQFEYNARNQISLWGPNGEIINYANKQWSGVVSHYFQPRWKLFIHYMNVSIQTKTKFNESLVRQEMFRKVEEPFTFDRSLFPTQPSGDTSEIAEELSIKWSKPLPSPQMNSPRKNRRKGRSSDEITEELNFQNYERRDPEVIVLG